MSSFKRQSKKFVTALSLFLCVLFIFSSVMTSFAWSDFTQTRTNIFRGAADNATVVLHLAEKDANGVITANPVRPIMNAEFQLYRIGEDGTETLIPGGPWYTDANGQIIFDGRDSKHQKLDAGKYVFVETRTPFGFTYDRDESDNDITRYEFEVTSADITSGKTVNVTAYNRRGNGTLAVKKTVVGDAPEGAEFTYTVHFSDGGTHSYRIDGGESVSIADGGTFTLKHGQTAVFADVPIGVQYRVTETAHPDYSISADGHQGNITEAGSVAAFVNTYATEPPSEEEVTLTVTKLLAGEYPNVAKDKAFAFTLIVDGEELTFTLKHGESKEFVVSEGSQYEIIEDNYFTNEYMQSMVGGLGTVGKEDIEVLVTNTFIGDPVVDIEGEKKWQLGSHTDVTLPEQITVRLKNGDTVVSEKIVKPDADGDWKYTFTAPKYDADGKQIKYTVEEPAVPCFIPSYSGYNITNTYIPPVVADPPVVTKVIKGENAPNTKFAFVMKGQDGAPMPEGAVGNSKTIYITGGGETEFGNIKFTNAGVYTYHIYETNAGEAGWTYDTSKYTLTFTVTEQNGSLKVTKQTLESGGNAASEVRFTNSYTAPEADTVMIAGEKRWEHGSNPTANRPDSITVYICADGKQVVQWQVTANDGWKYSFELPKFAADGHKITYTVDEKEIDGYTKRIDGYNLINTYVEKPNDPPVPSGPGETPGTGDQINPAIWFVLMIVSGTLLMVTSLLGRKNYVCSGKRFKRAKHGR